MEALQVLALLIIHAAAAAVLVELAAMVEAQ